MARLSKIRARATYANVTATLALFVALGGGSFAVALSGSEKKVVKKIAKKQADKRITARAPELSVARAGSADAATSANSATNAGHANTAGNADLLDGVDSTGFIGSGAAAGGDLDGVYPNPTIADDAVTDAKIADDAVTNAKIANDAVAGFQVQDRSLSGDEFLYSGDFPLNFPSIGSGNCSRLEIPIGGLFAVSHVVVTPPNHFADTFTLTGKVRFIDPGTSRVVLVACNVFGGGGAADPDGSGGNYGFLVIHDQ